MIRFVLVVGRKGTVVIEEDLFESLKFNAPPAFRAMSKDEAIQGMESLGLVYRHARIGRWETEYFEATPEQAVLVKMFMQ